MARTPLLRALRKLAREHDAAEHLGITPAELRLQRFDSLSRRDFLKGAAGIAAAGALAPALKFAPALAAQSRIAIVGAGISGLTAALTLKDKGLAATIYEASPRIGGRMHSDQSGYWADGQVSEFCGELIDSGHTTILGLANRFGLAVDDLLAAQPQNSTDTYFFLNRRYTVAQADADFVPVRAAAKKDLTDAGYPTLWNKYKPAGFSLDHMSVYDWIRTRVPGGHSSSFGKLLDVAYNIEYGAETRDQSSLNLLYLLAYQPSPKGFAVFGVSDEQYHIRGGNQGLPEAIAETLRPTSPIRTGWRMRSIEVLPDRSVGLVFDTSSGAMQVIADEVILTLPFAVLRTLDFSRAGFDGMKRKAINELGAGRNAKLQLQFDSRYWNTSGPWGISNGGSTTDLGYQNTWEVSRAQAGQAGIIVDYTGGDVAGAFQPGTPYSRADANPKVAAYARAFLREFETVFPGISARWNGRATLAAPILDPNLLCSYSYWRVGQYTAFGGYEGVAQGAIHFAGEHTSQDFQGFMEGGASEGIRAALEVVHALAGNG
jgi:monoamine oxidase